LAVAVVTDSTSDIDPQRARELGMDVVPLFVVFGERSYRDYVDLPRSEFYRKLAREGLPSTSQPTSVMFADAFAPHIEAGNDVFCIVISSKLSGTLNAARAAAAEFPAGRVTVVDSKSASGGLGMQAMRANDLARRGCDVRQISAILEEERSSLRVYACLPDLSHVARTGRIGKARAVFGTLMKIVPVISLRDGEVVAEAQVRTAARAQETMIDLSVERLQDAAAARFLVMHTDAPELAQSILERLQARLGERVPRGLEVLEAGPVIAAHGGPGAVGIVSAPW
jgi:DegV family protein with EDD domain